MNFPIRLYQLFISPMLGCNCRYLPTCSEYAREACAIHGLLRGGLLTAWRLLGCNPFAGHGIDPVPTKFSPRDLCVAVLAKTGFLRASERSVPNVREHGRAAKRRLQVAAAQTEAA